MTIWALADLHLSFGVPDKSMDLFGPEWERHAERIEQHWVELVKPDDLVLVAGDISWAMRLDEALADLAWIERLPGTKIVSKGNHDYWWTSAKRMAELPFPSIRFLHGAPILWRDVAIGGTRLWDTHEFGFGHCVQFRENPRAKVAPPLSEEEKLQRAAEQEKIFVRELERLRLSLAQLPPDAKRRIAMVHYPPVSADLAPSRASAILEEFHIDLCVFGHLHSLHTIPPFGTARGVRYVITSADLLQFTPAKVFD